MPPSDSSSSSPPPPPPLFPSLSSFSSPPPPPSNLPVGFAEQPLTIDDLKSEVDAAYQFAKKIADSNAISKW